MAKPRGRADPLLNVAFEINLEDANQVSWHWP